MSRAILIATLMAAVSAFSSPAKVQAPLKTKPSGKSGQPTYMITAHTVVHDDSSASVQRDDYTIVYGSEVLKVRYESSQIGTLTPEELKFMAPGKDLHSHTWYGLGTDGPDVSQVPYVGVPFVPARWTTSILTMTGTQ